MLIVTSKEMRALDDYAINDLGVGGLALMEKAGRGVADILLKNTQDVENHRILVVCGKGNNGGDGFVAARYLCHAKKNVKVVLLSEPEEIKGDSLFNYNKLRELPVDIYKATSCGDLDFLRNLAADSNVIIDAIFGTGLSEGVRGFHADVIKVLNGASCKKVAVDIPSGVVADSGEIPGAAFRADITVTFASAKVGHFIYPGAGHAGKLFIVDIGIPSDAPQYSLVKRSVLERSYGKDFFPRRNRNTHKNHYGHLLCIGGLSGKAGALLLAGLSALRTGVGLCTIASDSVTASNIEGRVPELMVESAGRIENDLFLFDPEKVSRLIEGKSAIVIGMGLSRREGTASFLEFVLSNCDLPVVIDADAINLISENRRLLEIAKSTRAVFTPHPGELSRIHGISSSEIQSRRLFYAEKSALEFGTVFVLKGANSIISAPDGRTSVSTAGNPGMASGGTGDSLSGIIGALLAMGNPLFESACCGVLLHGIAGDLAAEQTGEYSLIAGDLISKIPEVIKEWQE